MPPLTTENLVSERTGNTVVDTPNIKISKSQNTNKSSGWRCCGGGKQLR